DLVADPSRVSWLVRGVNLVVFTGVGVAMIDIFGRVMETLEPRRGRWPVLWLAVVAAIGGELFYAFGLFRFAVGGGSGRRLDAPDPLRRNRPMQTMTVLEPVAQPWAIGAPTEHPRTMGLVELMLKDGRRLDALLRDEALAPDLIHRLLAVALVGFTIFSIAV